MPSVIYLHGFASSGNSPKSQALELAFGSENVFAPDLPIDPDETVNVIRNIVSTIKNFPIIFVGTSLGGFWANYFAHKYDAKCVIINPSISPDISMSKHMNMSVKHYKTNEDIVVTAEILDKFTQYKKELDYLYNGYLVNVFLAEDDDVIDYKSTLDSLEYYNSMTITPDGGHRYNEYWGNVIDKIKEIA